MDRIEVRTILEASDHQAEWLPVRGLGRRFVDVPHPICDAASEAYACYSIRSYRAAILLARSVIEAVAKDKGLTSGTLSSKIDHLAEVAELPGLLVETAHEIRHLGNEMALGDFVADVTEEECDDVLAFMSSLLQYIYQMPAHLTRYREAREARRANGRDGR
ncbi:DUF4145 domain-containing protein [Schaalia sp. 19OD2882]|uniref:DUF4145 domain-containing protein n=1 Tax=Schaalia sp. 19OD2882 TaxID=2794089 RepID=UPI001C1ECEE6|nr:DUF4145 domain-containing protein [Schaalia sp. 19OD2882]QWW20142.1 DUF4145 domain-containing protein [Schaalia sp. 19OD2882]